MHMPNISDSKRNEHIYMLIFTEVDLLTHSRCIHAISRGRTHNRKAKSTSYLYKLPYFSKKTGQVYALERMALTHHISAHII